MALDGLTLTTIIAELRAGLLPGKIDRILQPAATEIHLTGRTGPRHWRLLLSAHPVNSRLHLTKESKPNPPQPPLFCMVLRKHLEGGRLLAIEQEPWERVVRFHIEAGDELGGLTGKLLVLEIMGKHSNLILVDKTSGRIIDGIRRYTHAVSRYREVLPGRKYITPPPQSKLPPDSVNEENLARIIYQLPENTLLAAGIQKSIAGLSPETAREICFQAGLPTGIVTGNCGHYELSRVIVALRDLLTLIDTGRYTPYIYWLNNCPQAFAPWPLRHLSINTPECKETATPTINAALDDFFCSKNHQDKVAGLRNAMQRHMAAAWERIQRKKTSQEQDIAAAREGLRYRQWGELLLTNLYRINPGDNCCFAEDPANPGQTHHLELNPALTPTENVQRFFRKYNKARQTVTRATEQLNTTCVELAYIESVLTALEQAEGWDDILEIRHELRQTEYLKKEKADSKPAKTGKSRRKQAKPPATPPKPTTIIGPDGWTIWLGRNNRQNDHLTMRLARENDIWLHAKDIPGSHVIIPVRSKQQPPGNVLEEAAAYAAYYSRAREAAKVPVDYTERRHVRKPAGAKPGYVIYEHQKTLWVKPKKLRLE